jgi:hypothetical protein
MSEAASMGPTIKFEWPCYIIKNIGKSIMEKGAQTN